MRKISQETKTRLNELLFKGPDQDLIDQFGYRESGAIPGFFSMCLNWGNTYAWQHLNQWISRVPLFDLNWLDCEFRLKSYKSGVFECEFNYKLPLLVRCLMTFHLNGKIREQALKDVGRNFGGEELPFLLLRLNSF